MAELHLVPDERVAIQAALYLAGLAAAHVFLVKPLVALGRERVRRTLGSSSRADSEQQRIDSLDDAYKKRMAAAIAEAKAIRQGEVTRGAGEAEDIIRSASDQAREQFERAKVKIEAQLMAGRAQVKTTAADVARMIVDRLVVPGGLAGVLFALGYGQLARAAEGGSHVDFWYAIFWPYVQFGLFALGFWYFSRKGFAGLLEKKRDALRTQLSEAHQATKLAEAKVKDYESKVASLEADIVKMREQHAAEGLRQRENLKAEAQKTRDQILRDAEKRTAELIDGARDALRRELVEETLKAVTSQLDPVRLSKINGQMRTQALSLVQSMGSGGK